MKATSNLNLILSGFASMNIEVLDANLKDEYSYQDTTKDVFLNELEKLFNEYKSQGDTSFTIYKGKCSGEGCTGCGKNGFRFVGNVSRNYFSILFIADDAGIVTDIYECHEFVADLMVENLESSNWIYIYVDDRINFNKTPEYWIKLNAALAACNEIVNDTEGILDFDTVDYWLRKHEFTAKRIGSPLEEPSMKWQCFTDLYQQLTGLRNHVNSYETFVANANKEYRLITDERSLILWMLEYEAMFNKVPYEFRYVIRKNEDNYVTKNLNHLVFTGNRFCAALSFSKCYNKHQTELLNKYGTYTEDELAEVVCHEQYDYEANPAFSLKFHLERRVELAKLGAQVGLYVNGHH
jgi:hypothetical protein